MNTTIAFSNEEKIHPLAITVACEICGVCTFVDLSGIKKVVEVVGKLERRGWVFDEWKSNNGSGVGWFCDTCMEEE